MKKYFFVRKYRIVVLAVVVGFLAAAASWTMAKSDRAQPRTDKGSGADAAATLLDRDAKWSKAILTVSNMSCGGCIDTIKKSVAGLKGTGIVNVDLASSSAEVMYEDALLNDPAEIARAITNAGYPADIKRLVAPAQLHQELAKAADQAKTNIARVGDIDIARKDFEIELGHARSRYEQIYGSDTFASPRGKQLLQRIEAQIAVRLIDEATKLEEVDRADYALPAGRMETALANYAKENNKSLDQLKSDLEANGYPFAYFKRKFGQRLRLQGYLEEKVLSGSIDKDNRRQRYNNWLANAKSLAEVTYYDKGLETKIKAGGTGGCGGGAGGCSGSSGCSVSR